MNSEPQLVAVCTQIAKLVIIDQVLKYSLLLPILFTIVISVFIFKKSRQRIKSYRGRTHLHHPSKLSKILRKHKIDEKLLLVINEKSLVAETVGFVSPLIIISQKIIRKLPPKQLEAVVLHEYYHCSRFHPFWKFLSNIVSAVFFFFPIIKETMLHLQLLQETSADKYSSDKMNSPKHLHQAIISLISNTPRPNYHASHFVDSNVRQRILHTTQAKNPQLVFGKKAILTSLTSLFFLWSLWSAQTTLAKMVDSSPAGKELRSSCSFLQCVSGCQVSLKLYSEDIMVSRTLPID